MAESLLFYVLIVVFVATLVRSALGFGEALILVPLLALRIPIAVAAPLAVMVSVVAAGAIVAQDWRRVEPRSAGVWLLATLFGISLGFLLLTRVDAPVVKAILGTVIIAFSVFSIRGGSRRHFTKDHWGWLLGCGFAAGVPGGAYGMNGPPLAVYGSLRRWSPQRFRATLQGCFLPASLVGLGGYIALGLVDWRVIRYFLFSLPVMLPALALGHAINKRLIDHRFFLIVYSVLIMTGGALVVQALARRRRRWVSKGRSPSHGMAGLCAQPTLPRIHSALRSVAGYRRFNGQFSVASGPRAIGRRHDIGRQIVAGSRK